MLRLVLLYNHREGINPEGKEESKMKYDTTMEMMVDEVLAEMEAKGEKLPNFRWGSEEEGE